MLAGLLALAVVLAVGVWAAWLWIDARLPAIATFAEYARTAPQVTRVLAADGTVIDELFVERRSVVPLGAIPRSLRLAVIAAEDADFLRHRGLDPWGIARALLRDVVEGRLAQGGSTITQQVARTFYLSAEKTLTRKVTEAVLAIKLERELTKDAILALYLNQIYFGHGRWGVQEAARWYFGKDVQGVTLAEAALLAGVVQSPGRLSPFVAPEAARRRRAYVLEQMVRNGFVDGEKARLAGAEPLPERPGDGSGERAGGYFVDAVRRELLGRLSPGEVLRGGLRVRTTLDWRLQRQVEGAVDEWLRAVDARTGSWTGRLRHGSGAAARIAALRDERRRRPSRPGQVVPGVVRSVRGDGATLDLGDGRGTLALAELSRYATVTEARRGLRPGDELPVRVMQDGRLWPELGPQAAVVAMEPATGAVRALVGGESFDTHPYNRAVQARRQPGSTFKLFVYAAALAEGLVEPGGTIELPEHGWADGRGGRWWPGGGEAGETLGVREAFARSSNVAAVTLLRRVGIGAVADVVRRLGVRSPIGGDLTVALGSSDVTLLELTGAYAAVAAGGQRAAPRLVEAVLDPSGRNIWPEAVPPTQAVPEEVAVALQELMRAVVTDGTGTAAAVEGLDVMGKTGTSDEGRDSWFVGAVPGLAVGVWLGRDDSRPVPDGGGGRLAAPLFRRIVEGRAAPREAAAAQEVP